MKKICHRRYFIGCYDHTFYDYMFKEVPREDFVRCLKNITKQEYKILINEKTLCRGNVYFRITNEYKFIKDKFDLMLNEIYETFDDRFYVHRALKIIKGIKCERINKENLYEEIAKFTKKVKSEHSLNVWKDLANWFENAEW